MTVKKVKKVRTLKDGSLAPEWRSLAILETDDWSKEASGYDEAFKLAGKEFYGTYVYDARRIVHCCELAGSYELYRIGTTGSFDDRDYEISEDEREWLDDWFRQAEHNPVIYVHYQEVDRIEFGTDKHRLEEDFNLRSARELKAMDWEETRSMMLCG